MIETTQNRHPRNRQNKTTTTTTHSFQAMPMVYSPRIWTNLNSIEDEVIFGIHLSCTWLTQILFPHTHRLCHWIGPLLANFGQIGFLLSLFRASLIIERACVCEYIFFYFWSTWQYKQIMSTNSLDWANNFYSYTNYDDDELGYFFPISIPHKMSSINFN